MIYTKKQLLEFKTNLVQELKQAQANQKNSILYAKNTLLKSSFAKDGDKYQVVMIGGTYLESAIVSSVDGLIKIHQITEESLPKLSSKEIVSQIFLKHLNPDVKTVSINFAYPIKPVIRDQKLDGILVRTPKEHPFEGLLNQKIGQFFELESAKKGQKIDVLVCNDTTALGLASIGFDLDYTSNEVMVGVIGTGFNFGIFENDNLFVNLELGNFDKFTQTQPGKLIDLSSQNVGQNKFEKEVGGAYLCHHFNYYSKKEGYNLECQTTEELSQVARKTSEVGRLASQVFEKSAQLVALAMTSIYQFKNPKSGKMLSLLEGGLYWKGVNFIQFVDKWMSELMQDKSSIQINSIDRIGIVGGAKLVRRLKD